MDPKDYPPLPPPEIVNVSKENLSGLPEEICAFADKVLGKGWSQLLNKDCYDAEDYQLALQQVLLLNVAVHVNEQLTEDDLNTLSSEEDKQKRLDIHQKRSGIAKRLTLLFQGMMMSIPLVPYTEEQRLILRDEVFLQLLQKLGLHLGLGDSQMYPRVPLFWKADVLFAIAARLGPMRKDKLKFTYEELMLADPNHDPILRNTLCPPLPPLSSCCTLSSWLTAVQQSKEYYRTSNINKTAF